MKRLYKINNYIKRHCIITAVLDIIAGYMLQLCQWRRIIFKRHRMREPSSDGNLYVMFFKNVQIICLMTLLTKAEEGLFHVGCNLEVGCDILLMNPKPKSSHSWNHSWKIGHALIMKTVRLGVRVKHESMKALKHETFREYSFGDQKEVQWGCRSERPT